MAFISASCWPFAVVLPFIKPQTSSRFFAPDITTQKWKQQQDNAQILKTKNIRWTFSYQTSFRTKQYTLYIINKSKTEKLKQGWKTCLFTWNYETMFNFNGPSRKTFTKNARITRFRRLWYKKWSSIFARKFGSSRTFVFTLRKAAGGTEIRYFPDSEVVTRPPE